MTNRTKHRITAAVIAVLGLSLAGVPALSAAGAQPEERANTPPETELSVIRLKYIDVHRFSAAVRKTALDPYSFMTVDDRSNSIILNATAESTQRVNELVEILDVQITEDEGDEEIQVFSLKHAAVNNSLILSLAEVLHDTRRRGVSRMLLSMDQSTNQLIARGTVANLTQLGALLERLDRPAQEARAATDINVRLIWLTTSATREVPADMKDVTDALADMGITGLSMAAQTIIRTTNRSEFVTEFTTGGDEPWFVRFEGTAETSDAENWTMTVSLRARRARSDGPGVPGSVEFETRLSTQAGHFVVLGVSPIGDTDSVFVLQVIEAN